MLEVEPIHLFHVMGQLVRNAACSHPSGDQSGGPTSRTGPPTSSCRALAQIYHEERCAPDQHQHAWDRERQGAVRHGDQARRVLHEAQDAQEARDDHQSERDHPVPAHVHHPIPLFVPWPYDR